MTWPAFFLRLVGREPKQVKEQTRFEENLSELSALIDSLDEVSADLQGVHQVLQAKGESLSRTIASAPPQKLEIIMEEPDEPRHQARAQFASDTGT